MENKLTSSLSVDVETTDLEAGDFEIVDYEVELMAGFAICDGVA